MPAAATQGPSVATPALLCHLYLMVLDLVYLAKFFTNITVNISSTKVIRYARWTGLQLYDVLSNGLLCKLWKPDNLHYA